MRIFLRGSEDRIKVMQEKIGKEHDIIFPNQFMNQSSEYYNSFDILFDLGLDEEMNWLPEYKLTEEKILIGCAVKKSLSQMCAEKNLEPRFHFAGINAFPFFLEKKILEISFFNEKSKNAFEKIAIELNWQYKIIKDQTGMVTPRVICMIINEAFFTLQEGIASHNDIETGMKLGTAFPYGPFEWCEKIGIKNVYETLEALYIETNDERYKICELLKEEYRQTETVHG
jgi:3-hydroxybutyryl-CoA dehydrogenase